MSPLWKKLYRFEGVNHHFSELASSNNLKSWFWNLTCCRSALVVLAALNLLAGFFYLTQTNLTATSGYEIKNLEKEMSRLMQENNNYNLDYIRLQSMDQIVSGAGALDLVPADNIEIIEADKNTIAINR